MKHARPFRFSVTLLYITLCVCEISHAQEKSNGNRFDSFLLKRKGLMGQFAKNMMAHHGTGDNPSNTALSFLPFQGMIIRNISVQRVGFGISINDTTKKFRSQLTTWANDLHHNTRESVIRHNLFFKSGDILQPYLMADNEAHLRDLSFLQDATITIIPVEGNPNMADILVQTKDVLSLGGSFRMHSMKKVSAAISEDNFAGWGHALVIRGLFDKDRMPNEGYGGEYIYRNILGSFMDVHAGYLNFNKNFNTGTMSEEEWFARFIRPLVNPYMKFTYAGEVAYHNTADVYRKDSVYSSDHKYRYYNYDGWVGWNTGPFKLFGGNNNNRLRTLVSARYLQQNFSEVPDKYLLRYHYAYADLRAALAAVSIFKQDFYTIQNVYGFGRTEDIPEGVDLSFTAGWTEKSGQARPYVGFDFQKFFFTGRKGYFNYTARAGGFLNKQKMEDINLLFSVNYFSRLVQLGAWKQRTFINAGFTHQERRRLNEPLFLQNDFGLREWRADTLTEGDTRATLKMESLFYSPINIANFRFAPFIFGNLCLFHSPFSLALKKTPEHLYSSVGAGIRFRNESLVFETMELKAFYFPEKNFRNEQFRVEFNTGIRFKYNSEQVKRPDFVTVN
jgi:hypothetical protein